MTYWATSDGWTVETVKLSMVPEPSRPGDPKGDGEYFKVRYHGTVWDHVRTVEALRKIVDFADLREVDKIRKDRQS